MVQLIALVSCHHGGENIVTSGRYGMLRKADMILHLDQLQTEGKQCRLVNVFVKKFFIETYSAEDQFLFLLHSLF